MMNKLRDQFLTRLYHLEGKKIVLASQSPRRIELLRSIGLDCEVMPSDIKEEIGSKADSIQIVRDISFRKAQSVFKRANADLVIAADTVVTLDNEIFGKPQHAHEAATMLRKLSARIHRVITGLCLFSKTQQIVDHEITKVTFYKLTDEEINAYLSINEYADKAGAYGIQELASLFVKKIEGCYFNVVGFPLGKFYQCLKGIKF